MRWDEVQAAASSTSWIAYVGTASADGVPHVAVVSPGLSTDGTIWFATRAGSRKLANLRANPRVAFHWPVGGSGPGELIASGRVTIHDDQPARDRLWDAGVLPYDPSGFFGGPDNPDLVFVETTVARVRLLGPDFVAREWMPT